MPKTKAGEKITWKEFGRRWKKGIQEVTPLQQVMSTIFGQVLILVGIVWGIVASIIFKQWWLLIILAGSLFVSGTSMIGTLQKYIALKRVNDMMKGGLEDE